MKAMRVKICGITSTQDAAFVASAGADAIGLVFYEPSPRFVSLETAAAIARLVGPFVSVVGLFVNANKETIEHVMQKVPLNLLQFHGDEPLDFCEQFSLPYMKAIRMREDLDVDHAMAHYPSASAILLDAYQAGVPGGTGESFDWQRVPKQASQHIVLAGGLTSDNVKTAIEQTRPYGVDVSGGVELSPGVKDSKKVAAFIDNAKNSI